LQLLAAYYVNESKFTVEHIDEIKNPSEFVLKCTLIRHRNVVAGGEGRETGDRVQDGELGNPNDNRKCIIYMHGLGSSRLEAFPFVESLPREYCLFVFDFAGCGKSEGDDITYGLREAEDVNSIIDYLRVNKGIKEFVLWGRSMGAVVALLYAIELS
jgi:pimeloyl-ACP methyl ester carboxylesterase